MKPFPFVLLIFSLVWGACQSSEKQTLPKEPSFTLAEMVIGYMSSPRLPEIGPLLLGSRAQFVGHDAYREVLFLKLKDKNREELYKICLDTSVIVYGERVGEWKSLEGEAIPAEEGILFRFADDLLRIDPERMIEVGDFSLSVQEFYEMSLNEGIYNGPILFNVPLSADTLGMTLNHSAPVAYGGNKVLQRLVNKLVSDTSNKKQSAQELLDFVTHEITYEDHGGFEIIMRPHEVLTTRRSDCSGKVVLYASLLEQLDIPYLLAYMPNHIAVFVAGDFSNENKLSFVHEGQAYSWAETTAPGFIIGESVFDQEISPAVIEQLQYPGFETRLFDVRTGDSLDFVTAMVQRKVR